MIPKGGFQSMIKKAQKLQEKMQAAQNELVNIEAEGQAGGGLVVVTSNGKKEIKSIKIDNEILNEDVEMVEDLILVAVNQALSNAQEMADEKIKSVTGGMMGGMNIPGM
tara:strand:+ start:108 stop:434 length:327 start_codon:yes stop_codon:yes gene_type:complete